MSDFPMPKTVPVAPYGDYAPKRGLEAVADAIQPPAPPPASAYAKGDYKPSTHAAVIKEKLKALTHREMKELVTSIFEAQKKLGEATTEDSITRVNMPDVLDAFAYGD